MSISLPYSCPLTNHAATKETRSKKLINQWILKKLRGNKESILILHPTVPLLPIHGWNVNISSALFQRVLEITSDHIIPAFRYNNYFCFSSRNATRKKKWASPLRIMFTVGNVDRYIGRRSGRQSIDTRSILDRHSVDCRSRVDRLYIECRTTVDRGECAGFPISRLDSNSGKF